MIYNLDCNTFSSITKYERLKRSNLIVVPISVCLLDSFITSDAGSSEIVTESNYILDFAACKFLPSWPAGLSWFLMDKHALFMWNMPDQSPIYF